MITAVLVDDEKNALEILEWQLQTYCPQVKVMAPCRSADEGAAAIRQYKPQLLFLDVEMPQRSGFDMLTEFPEPTFDIIFTTAFDRFAIAAFKYAALDYLLKPIDADDLIAAVQRFEKKERRWNVKEQLQTLMQQYQQPTHLPEKLAFATQEGILFIKPETILRCESASNYTTVYFTDGTKLVLSKTLKEMEEALLPYGFCRVHHSHLINVHQASRYAKTDGGFVQMTDGSEVPISRQRKDEVLKALMNKL